MGLHGWRKAYKNCLVLPISTRCIFFSVAHSIRTSQLSVLDLEQFWDGWPTRKFPSMRVRTKHVEKIRVGLWGQSAILKAVWDVTGYVLFMLFLGYAWRKIECINMQWNKKIDFLSLDHHEFDMHKWMNVTSKCRKNLDHKAKQIAEPLLVHTNSTPPIPGASQAIRGLEN